MRRDEPGHALPAWLQDESAAESDSPPVRRPFRRAARSSGEPEVGTHATADRPPHEVTEHALSADETRADPVESPPVSPVPPAAPTGVLQVASVPFGTSNPAVSDVVSEPVGSGVAELEFPAPEPEHAGSEPAAPEPERALPEVVEHGAAAAAVTDSVVAPDGEAEVDETHSAGDTETIRDVAPHPLLSQEEHDRDDPALSGPRLLDHQPSTVDLASGVLVRRSRRSPSGGWRRGVHRFTRGLLDPGESAEGAHRDDLVERIRQPISGDYRVAVLSLKGGVGKTTTTIGLGSTFASLRGDCVVAVDANPDFGTLAQRIPQQTESTVRDLLAAAPTIQRYSDVRAHTSQAPSRLEVLASERDPAASEAFSEDDYRQVVDILQVFYNIILTDCGTGIMHSAMRGVLDLANALVLVGSPAVDGARSAAATLDWLQAHGYDDLVERTVVVISSPRPGSSNIDMDALSRHFLARCRALQVLPFDEHLAEGAEIDLDRLRPATRRAFVELAAMVADDFPPLSGRHSGQW